ncbi:MAG: serine protease [Methylococcales bacterium]|nr:serine protease [Methylococcales bacterium]
MFKKIKFGLILILLLISHGTHAERIPKIVGGETTSSAKWPWMAALAYQPLSENRNIFCGASLIAKDWLLTAAHCVIGETTDSFGIVIHNERLFVARIIIHPSYNKITFDNDLALIQLTHESKNDPIKIISPYTSQDRAEKMAIALGWGTTSATETIYPTQLQQVALSIVDTSICRSFMGNVTENMLCAGDDLYQKDTCQGDSGGPLVVFDTESNTWQQAGITSWGFKCAQKDSYGVYTRVKKYTDFISKTICTDNALIPPVLALTVTDDLVTAQWTHAPNATGYRLNYALYPQGQVIHSIDMNQLGLYSVALKAGDAYYVAITNYRDNCLSDFSNIESFSHSGLVQ